MAVDKPSGMWPGLQDIIDNLLVLVARAALAFLLSVVFGPLLYFVTLPVVLSIWELSYIDFGLMGILTIGIGSGVGSFLGWLNRNLGLRLLLLMLALSVAAAMGGAWGGLQHGRDVYQLGGLPGIPALSGIIIGAMLGGNLFNIAVWILKTVRNPRV